ncbi:Zinc finger RING-type protein [Neofusicoccum parvum]|uniref:Putative ring-14 protein n=1 Tax=Botryosphaeria parva (strain UCR-NP2) TaxID=1287680 RepID=R1EBA8_BOTPV|nr:putative ring-14 protein [Neofusicoccum parvum UCRNP2]GME34551.1 Zinc finger RING-type protein [Neofusicoccum parvum]
MKFGHAFQDHLQQDGFPAHWVASAISYRQLKKCIKRVQKELAGLGLDAATLGQLLRTAEQERDEKLAEYLLSNPQSTSCHPDAPALFQPKLLIAVDEDTGEPLDAHLSPKTREYMHQLATTQQLSDTDMAKWRKIFELYLESKIFFSTNELDHGKHDSAKAQVLLKKFSDELQRQEIVSSFRKKESSVALEQFLQLNMNLLQTLRFQEINDLAMHKILKSRHWKYFPEEVKAKQKENERAAGVDRYGEAYNDKCVVM